MRTSSGMSSKRLGVRFLLVNRVINFGGRHVLYFNCNLCHRRLDVAFSIVVERCSKRW